MAVKKIVRKPTRPARASRAKVSTPKSRLENAWAQTLGALHGAQLEAEKQVHLLLKKNKLDAKDAAGVLAEIRGRIDKERHKAVKQLEAQAGKLQHRLTKERKAAGKMVDEAVRGALAALNIPSRQEITELTHKVDELSSKIDGLKRR